MKKHNEGFSLVETLVAITVLAIIVVPTCTSMVMSVRMNAKAKTLMQAELAVSSAVEQLMAKGVSEKETYTFSGVSVSMRKEDAADPFYEVSVASTDPEAETVKVTTYIRATQETTPSGNGGQGGVG